LKSIPIEQRNALLISISIEAILKYGPDYYRDYQQPVIINNKYPSADQFNDNRFIAWAERYYYDIIFLYDKTEETLECEYAAKIRIWADTGHLHSASFGNGYGRLIPRRAWIGVTI